MKVSELARQLGVTPDAIYKLRRKGMPTHSLDAARAWREANLDPCRRQGGRIDRPALSPAAAVAELGIQAWERIQRGAHPEPALAAFRAALRRLDPAQRAAVRLPLELWEWLISPVAAVLPDSPTALTDAEAADMGDFWSRVAAGEVRVNPPPIANKN